jgi:hypothetical protein
MITYWVVTWRTTNHVMLGTEANKPRRRYFDNQSEAQEWVDYLREHEVDFCTDIIMFEAQAVELQT